MAWPKGTPRPPGAGRTMGTKNKSGISLKEKRQLLQEKAESHDVDVFEILVLFAGGKWKELGYDKETQTKSSGGGETYEVRIITPEIRVKAAADACQYLHPKLKTIEATIKGVGDEEEEYRDMPNERVQKYEPKKTT